MGGYLSTGPVAVAKAEVSRDASNADAIEALRWELGFAEQPPTVVMEFYNPQARSDWPEFCAALESGADYKLCLTVPNGDVSVCLDSDSIAFHVSRLGGQEDGALGANLPRALFAAPLAVALRQALPQLE